MKLLYMIVLVQCTQTLSALHGADESVMYHQEMDEKSNQDITSEFSLEKILSTSKDLIPPKDQPLEDEELHNNIDYTTSSYNSFLEYKKAMHDETVYEDNSNGKIMDSLLRKNFLKNVIESLLNTKDDISIEKEDYYDSLNNEVHHQPDSIRTDNKSTVQSNIYSLYVGLGYNILKGNPDGSFENGGIDPGINSERYIFNLIGTVPLKNHRDLKRPEQVSVLEDLAMCTVCSNTSAFNGFRSYQKKLRSSVSTSDYFGISRSGYEFTVNNDFTTSENIVFLDKEKTCKHISVRLKENARLSSDFYNAVKDLPLTAQNQLDTSAYIQFINDWGTHFITEAYIGTKTIVRNTTSYEGAISFLNTKNKNGVSLGGSFRGRIGKITTTIEILNESLDGAELGTTSRILNISSAQDLYPIHLQLSNITNIFFQENFWTDVLQLDGATYISSNISQKGQNLNAILGIYPIMRGADLPSKDPIIEIPLPWPEGTYALIQPAYHGCPQGWRSGFRHQDTKTPNTWHPNITEYINGSFELSDIILHYCVKTGESRIKLQWPKGTYCIARKGNCPLNFLTGYIHWDDENQYNHNNKHGILPDGKYNKDTRVYYCCRCDYGINRPINLPTNNAFVLLSYDGKCQQVRGMAYKEIWLQYADERDDHCRGVHPYDTQCNSNHNLKFCYYIRQ